ncbi:MAG TPA: 16S rRNA (cytosine(967)-C(5))-methyltransferase RsmB [Rhodothermales bacterium]|nr:16S rRNA (cytosine(967)-C(5))-methyltransferase RsmB [Rhodothermales bacterium]
MKTEKPISTSPPSARGRAVRQLERIEQAGAFVGFSGEDEGSEIDPRDERLVTEYVAGVTRWRRWLDFLLASAYRDNLEKMEPRLRQILRVGLYDLLYLNTPPHAALNEAVNLAKRQVRPGAGGLVNGILRTLHRRQGDLPQPDTGDPAEDLAIRYSHPTWMAARWLERYGTDRTVALLEWNDSRPVYGVRINTLKGSVSDFHGLLDAHGISWEPSPYLETFVRTGRVQGLVQTGFLADGHCAVQDESAGLIVALLDPQPGETVVDCCAAPGGKSTHAAQRMRNEGRVIAFDVHEGRLALVRRAAEQQGAAIVETHAGDFREAPTRFDGLQADRVLLDAPCSGLGVLAKRADLRWNRSPEEIEQLTHLQDELLDAAARVVRPGGLLVYSTCTIEPEENEGWVAAFLARRPEFALESASGFVPEEMVSAEGFYSTFSPRDRIDGAFGARLRRK